MTGPPRYQDLPLLAGERCAWGVFGPGDELGTLNWVTPEHVLAATRAVRDGRVVNVDLPVGFGTATVGSRHPPEHHLTISRSGADDWLDGFYLQGSSQWDGLRHIRYREHGWYGGRTDDFLESSRDLGVDAWARHGIVSRAVLVDLPRYCAASGLPWEVTARTPIGAGLLDRVLAHQGVEVGQGDILLVRTGWLSWYRGARDDPATVAPTVTAMSCAGLDPSPATAAWLWDRRVAAVALDNPAVEVLPVDRDEGFLHRRLLALLGMPLGEFWDLDELAGLCAADGRYDGLLVSSPLNLPGGAGSPCNAYVLR